MSITIGICDDQPEQIRLLQFFLEQMQRSDLTVVHATDPNEFRIKLKADKPDLVFLDIDMPGMDGMRLCEQIKAMYDDIVVVFITAHEQYALEAFRLRAFHYLLKPLTRDTFNRVLGEALRRIEENRANRPDKVFLLQTKGESICFSHDEIQYFEKIGHKIAVHTEGRVFLYYGNFADLLCSLDPADFVQCHQGYIANVKKTKGFRDKTLMLEGNLQIPVSRTYVEKIKDTLATRLFGTKGEKS